jgi:hypothetical protein
VLGSRPGLRVLTLPRLQLVDLTLEAKSEGLVEHARREFHQQIMLNLGKNSKVYCSSVLLLVAVVGIVSRIRKAGAEVVRAK